MCLAMGVAVGCHRDSPGSRSTRTETVTNTRDAATAGNGGINTGSVMSIGGVGSLPVISSRTGANPLQSPTIQYVTVCDQSMMVDAVAQGKSDGTWNVTNVAGSGSQVKVCSYSISNGDSVPLDVQFYAGGNAAIVDGVHKCPLAARQPLITYHLGPYGTITQGSGIGVLYAIPDGFGICAHRVQNGSSPLSVEITYAIY